MIEIPEAINLAAQLSDTISGKRIIDVTAQHTPHKLAWYYGDPAKYSGLLAGKNIDKARAYGGLVEIQAENANILFGDGVGARFHSKNEARPDRHQLLIEFEDGTAISLSIQMYGGVGCFTEGTLDNRYYLLAKEKPSPLSPQFDENYFNGSLAAEEVQKLSLKGLLATEQRIPGLGNGVLQDILFNAKMHPKKKASMLSGKDIEILFNAVKITISKMTSRGGRDTELDLFGNSGGYQTILCKTQLINPVLFAGR